MIQNYRFDATGRHINAAASYIRYEAETAGAPDPTIRIRADGQDLGEWLPGDDYRFPSTVTTIEIVPVAGAAGVVRVGLGDVKTSRMVITGSPSTAVSAMVSTRAAIANSAKTVTTASAQMVAANATRNYLMVQNNDPTGVVFIAFGAGPAAALGGLRIAPGGYWEWDSCVPTGAVHALGSIASNPNITVLEG